MNLDFDECRAEQGLAPRCSGGDSSMRSKFNPVLLLVIKLVIEPGALVLVPQDFVNGIGELVKKSVVLLSFGLVTKHFMKLRILI